MIEVELKGDLQSNPVETESGRLELRLKGVCVVADQGTELRGFVNSIASLLDRVRAGDQVEVCGFLRAPGEVQAASLHFRCQRPFVRGYRSTGGYVC